MNFAFFIAWFLASMRRPLIPPGAVRLGVGVVVVVGVDVESSLLSFLLGEISDADDNELGDSAVAAVVVAAVELALVTRLVSIHKIRPAGDSFVMIWSRLQSTDEDDDDEWWWWCDGDEWGNRLGDRELVVVVVVVGLVLPLFVCFLLLFTSWQFTRKISPDDTNIELLLLFSTLLEGEICTSSYFWPVNMES